MGAQLWHFETPWNIDPEKAFQQLQAKFVADNYNFAQLLPERLLWTRQIVAKTQKDGDRYGLLEMYEEMLQLLERLNSAPIPTDASQQIGIVRQLNVDSGEGVGNILDITGIADERTVNQLQRLSEPEMLRLVGTTSPTLEQARQAISTISLDLKRAEGVCFPFYDQHDRRHPAGWFFFGHTAD